MTGLKVLVLVRVCGRAGSKRSITYKCPDNNFDCSAIEIKTIRGYGRYVTYMSLKIKLNARLSSRTKYSHSEGNIIFMLLTEHKMGQREINEMLPM